MSDLAKAQLRLDMLERLRALDEHEHHRLSAELCQRVLEIPEIQNTSGVMAYLAQPPEPNLDPLLTHFLEHNVSISVPHVGDQGHGMLPIELKSLDPSELDVDRFGIRAPCIHKKISPASIDVVVIPGVAFGSDGSRLGRGGGFYDRFLNSLSEHTLRIGACFSVQNTASVPTKSHDLGVDLVVTELAIIDCR